MELVETNVSVEWILKNVAGSIDYKQFNWSRIVYTSCTHESISELVNSILTDGFIVPIQIIWDDVTNMFVLGNGHHRTSLAILMAADYIPAIFVFGDYFDDAAWSISDKFIHIQDKTRWNDFLSDQVDVGR